MTDIEAALTLQGMIPGATSIEAEALGLGVMILKSREKKRKELKQLLGLLGVVSVRHGIDKLNGKEEANGN